ncbi:MAG: DUF1648 domain-containing protein [Clostridia bacterium]|nr:DUF1648 domain-containing protein [Clostridia bacterium]
MEKKTNSTLIITTLVCLLPIILALVLYDKLPDQIAVHFDINGTPDNYMPKAIAVFGLPLFMAGINLFTHFMLDHDPRKENASTAMKLVGKWAVPLISLIVMPVTLFMAMGAEIPITMLVTGLVGILLVICGNYLPKSRRNYTVGIKLPWTLDSDENWNKTHRFAGPVWVVGGLLFIATAFVHAPYVGVGIIVALVALPTIYSYLTYRKESKTDI